jgi:hypothetical protein
MMIRIGAGADRLLNALTPDLALQLGDELIVLVPDNFEPTNAKSLMEKYRCSCPVRSLNTDVKRVTENQPAQVRFSWLLDCISAFQILDRSRFQVRPPVPLQTQNSQTF